MMMETDKILSPLKKWCFLTYIAGDNNLSNVGLIDIQEMCEEGASPDIYVGVEIDTYGEHTGSIRYEVTEADWFGNAHRIVIERLSEKDSGSPKTLKDFFEWGLRRYNAENYITVIWNHGSGFRTNRKNIGYDDFGSSLDMTEIEWAMDNAGINKENKLKILGFDACLMNMLEIVHHFKDRVEIIVGSQQTEPANGWPYDKVLAKIKSAESSKELSKEIVKAYIKSYEYSGEQNLTQSAINTSKANSAMKKLSDLGKLLCQYIDEIRLDIASIRYSIQFFDMADYVDAIHFAKVLEDRIQIPEIQEAAKKLIKSLKSCIIYNEVNGFQVKDATGLSIWFPEDQNLYFNNRAKYSALNFAQNHNGWISFLDTYFYKEYRYA